MFDKLYVVATVIADAYLTDIAFMEYKDQARKEMYKRPVPAEGGVTTYFGYVIDRADHIKLFVGDPSEQLRKMMHTYEPLEKVEKGIKEIMKHHGMTAAQMSEKFGISRQSLRDWSSGRASPKNYVLNLIEWALEYHLLYQYDENASVSDLPYSNVGIAKITGMPIRTLEDWKSGRRKPTKYVESLICCYVREIEEMGKRRQDVNSDHSNGNVVNEKMVQLCNKVGADPELLKAGRLSIEEMLAFTHCFVDSSGEIIDQDTMESTGIMYEDVVYCVDEIRE